MVSSCCPKGQIPGLVARTQRVEISIFWFGLLRPTVWILIQWQNFSHTEFSHTSHRIDTHTQMCWRLPGHIRSPGDEDSTKLQNPRYVGSDLQAAIIDSFSRCYECYVHRI